MPVPTVREVGGGWKILEVRGVEHVPGYDPAVVGQGLSAHTLRREIFGDWAAAQGLAVYPEFTPRLHVSLETLEWTPKRPLILGWDQGGAEVGGNPACVITQLSGAGQWSLFHSICPEEGDERPGVWEFARQVADYLLQEFAQPWGLKLNDLELIHYGDPAGTWKPQASVATKGNELKSCYDIIRDGIRAPRDEHGNPMGADRDGWGWNVLPIQSTLTQRIETMRSRFTTLLVGGHPAVIVDKDALDLIECLGGSYHYHERSDGRIELDPKKDRAADIANAAEFACSGLFLQAKPAGHPSFPRQERLGPGARRRERNYG